MSRDLAFSLPPTNLTLSSEFEAKALLGCEAINKLKNNGLVVVNANDWELVKDLIAFAKMSKEEATEELHAMGIEDRTILKSQGQCHAIICDELRAKGSYE